MTHSTLHPERLDRIVKGLIDRLSKEQPLAVDVEAAWQEAAQQLGGHAKVVSFKKGRLLVTVDSSAWLHRGAFYKDELLAKLNAALGEEAVKSIVFRIGELNA